MNARAAIAQTLSVLDHLRLDLRYAIRSLRRHPALVAGTVVSLGLGIGLNAVVFSITNAVMFKPLAAPAGLRLVSLYVTRGDQVYGPASYPDFVELRDHTRTLDALAAYAMRPASVRLRQTAREMVLCIVSGNFFGTMGARPGLGRLILPSDDETPGESPVAVVSYDYWIRALKGDPGAVGRTIIIDRMAFTLVGVAPRGFDGPMTGAAFDVYIPAMMRGALASGGSMSNDQTRRASWGWLVGRRRAGITPARVQAEFTMMAAALSREYPAADLAMRIGVVPDRGLRPDIRRSGSSLLLLLSGITAIVMLIACANVAGLLLARTASRQRELAIRASLGASRIALGRQIGVESLLLAALGGLAAALIALWGTQGLSVLLLQSPADLGLRASYNFAPDARVYAFVAGASLACGLLFGLVAGVRAMQIAPSLPLREGSGGTARRSRLGNSAVVLQAALAVALMAAASALVRTTYTELHADAGFRTAGVAIASVSPSGPGYDDARTQSFYHELLRRLQTNPEISGAGLGSEDLLGGAPSDLPVRRADSDAPRSGSERRVPFNAMTPGTLELLDVPLVHGRLLTDGDRVGAPAVAVVNETLAHQLWPARSAVGQQMRVDSALVEVVGVVRDAKYVGVGDVHSPYMFLPYAQRPTPIRFAIIYARATTGDAHRAIAAITHEVAALDPDVPVEGARALTVQRSIMMHPARIAATLVGLAAALALILAAAGVHALISQSVALRTREMGIRLALGALAGDVRAMIVKQGTGLAAIGVLAGLPLGYVIVRALRRQIYGLGPASSVSLLAVVLLLLGVAATASWIPALKAARVDPTTVLRSE